MRRGFNGLSSTRSELLYVITFPQLFGIGFGLHILEWVGHINTLLGKAESAFAYVL